MRLPMRSPEPRGFFGSESHFDKEVNMYKLLSTLSLSALLIGAAGVPVWAQDSSAAAAKLFAQLDKNKDGKLGQAEFTADSNLTATQFADWDADGDKYVSKAEFVANYGKA